MQGTCNNVKQLTERDQEIKELKEQLEKSRNSIFNQVQEVSPKK